MASKSSKLDQNAKKLSLRFCACACDAVAARVSAEILPTPPIEGEKGNVLDSSRRWHGATGRSGPRRLLPCPALLEHRLPAVISMTNSTKVLGIVEGQPISIVLSDVEFRPDDVVDVGRSRVTFADDGELTQWITGKDEGDGLLAPGSAVIKFLEPGLAADAIPVPALL
jgi:hypothetical protein